MHAAASLTRRPRQSYVRRKRRRGRRRGRRRRRRRGRRMKRRIVWDPLMPQQWGGIAETKAATMKPLQHLCLGLGQSW